MTPTDDPQATPPSKCQQDAAAKALDELFPGDGPAATAMRAVDWDSTPLGPVADWPAELLSAIRTVLPSAVQQLIWWGGEFVQLYNDAYSALLGTKHPRAAGQRAADCWSEIWSEVGPMAEAVLAGEGAMFGEDLLLLLSRHGFVEETYWTFSYSPISDAGGRVLGVYVATRETTAAVVNARRTATLSGLGSTPAANASVPAVAKALIDVLSGNRGAVPAAVLYLADDAGNLLVPVAWYGIGDATPEPVSGDSGHPLVAAFAGREAVLLDTVDDFDFAGGIEPSPLGTRRPGRPVLIPLQLTTDSEPAGVLWLGTNPYRRLEPRYRTFLDLVGRQMATVLSDAIAYERGNRMVESLTELDQIKTRFFQNVSHEFRTPLTLMLGELADALSSDRISGADRERVSAARRAALRLQRLVDSLLDFARADAGRLQPKPVPTDLASFTAELAGMFSSTAEADGLEFKVHTLDAPGAVLIDRDMWSDIVLNLVSNAVKFTEHGSITLSLRYRDDKIVLMVADTGIGIPAAEQQKVFERFHQARSASARSGEGAGIGLSLVSELVSALGGEIGLSSTTESGSTFTVELPLMATSEEPTEPTGPADAGAALLNASRSAAAQSTAQSSAQSNAQLSGAEQGAASAVIAGRIMLVEDDPEMRSYLERILTEEGWVVDAAADVVAALSHASTPDLILSDVMLPGTNGIEFVRLLRSDPVLARLPVILLTARAGAGSAAEGLSAGADDYIVKPFDRQELLARVRVHRELAALREFALLQAEEKVANLQSALRTNREIGTAIGILMNSHRVTADEAFALLRTASQHQHRKLREIADQVNLTGALQSPDTTGNG